MKKNSAPRIVLALCTSAALIGFAFVERYGGAAYISASMLFIAAAIICVSPTIYTLLRCQIRRIKALNS